MKVGPRRNFEACGRLLQLQHTRFGRFKNQSVERGPGTGDRVCKPGVEKRTLRSSRDDDWVAAAGKLDDVDMDPELQQDNYGGR